MKLVKPFPVVGEVRVSVDDATAKRLIDEEGWKPVEQPKPRAQRRTATKTEK